MVYVNTTCTSYDYSTIDRLANMCVNCSRKSMAIRSGLVPAHILPTAILSVAAWTPWYATGIVRLSNAIILQDMGTNYYLIYRGSISKVMGSERVAISASYDATMILWNLANKSESARLVGPHK